MVYPNPVSIDQKWAARFIANVIYPDEINRRAAEHRIRQRIRDAHKRDELPSKLSLDPQQFFLWAVKKWPKLLANVEDLRKYAPQARGECSAELPKFTGSGYATQVPVDRGDLETAYVNSETALWHAAQEKKRLEAQVAELTTEIMKRQERDEATRMAHSEAGKKGKGVPRRRIER